jgi:hypothetical protein
MYGESRGDGKGFEINTLAEKPQNTPRPTLIFSVQSMIFKCAESRGLKEFRNGRRKCV